LIYLGLFLGQNWSQVAGILHYLVIVAAVVLGAVVILIVIRWRKNISKTSAKSSET
jgi:membrane protein DedA with SNARE-associated domain